MSTNMSKSFLDALNGVIGQPTTPVVETKAAVAAPEQLDESATKKDFTQMAKTIAEITDPAKRQEFADVNASVYAKANPRFDHAKFHRACGTKSSFSESAEETYKKPVLEEDKPELPEMSFVDFIIEAIHEKLTPAQLRKKQLDAIADAKAEKSNDIDNLGNPREASLKRFVYGNYGKAFDPSSEGKPVAASGEKRGRGRPPGAKNR